MKKIAVAINRKTGVITVDLGGDYDLGCCGCPARELEERHAKKGIELTLRGVYCRLPVKDRVVAKLSGKCHLSLRR